LKLVLNHMFQKFEIFWTNIASTMTYPNFKNGPKNGLRPLGVNLEDCLKDVQFKRLFVTSSYFELKRLFDKLIDKFLKG
jgi:hypothetical protein